MARDARALGVGTAEGYPFRDRLQFLASVGCGRRAVREDRDDTAHGRHLREVPLVEALDEATVAPFAFGQSLCGPPPVGDLFEPRENMCHFMAAPDRQAPDMEYPRPMIARDVFLASDAGVEHRADAANAAGNASGVRRPLRSSCRVSHQGVDDALDLAQRPRLVDQRVDAEAARHDAQSIRRVAGEEDDASGGAESPRLDRDPDPPRTFALVAPEV